MTQRGCLQAMELAGYAVARITADRQRPSLRKLMQHGGMRFMLPALGALGLADAGLPFAIPAPSVRLVTARPRDRAP